MSTPGPGFWQAANSLAAEMRKRDNKRKKGQKQYWVWRDGPNGYWIYDTPSPRYPNGDPKVLGEPCFSGRARQIWSFLELEGRAK